MTDRNNHPSNPEWRPPVTPHGIQSLSGRREALEATLVVVREANAVGDFLSDLIGDPATLDRPGFDALCAHEGERWDRLRSSGMTGRPEALVAVLADVAAATPVDDDAVLAWHLRWMLAVEVQLAGVLNDAGRDAAAAAGLSVGR